MVAEMKKMSEQLIEQNRTCLAQLNATMDVNGLYRPINFIVGIYIYIYIKTTMRDMYNFIHKQLFGLEIITKTNLQRKVKFPLKFPS